jgi:aryl-alcohol dehydrogenase
MRTRAAVMNEYNKPLTIEEVDLEEPQAGEVLVKMVASGICHSDMSAHQGHYCSPLPMILGHEGAGVVEAVGPGVTKLEKGDHVLLTVSSSCGHCKQCYQGQPFNCTAARRQSIAGTLPSGARRFSKNGQVVNYMFSQSSFAEHSVISERTAVKVSSDVPLEKLAPFGCGIQTGAGAVINLAKVGLMDSVAIFGCGGLGLSGIMASKALGASPIIAIDVIESRLELAKDLGATHVVNAAKVNPVEKILEITGGGADYTFESIGKDVTIRQAVDSTRWNGSAIISGLPPIGSEVKLDALKFLGVNILGNSAGMGVPEIFLPKLVDLWSQGKLPLERFSKTYSLSQVNQAFADMANGSVVKPIILF